MSGVSAGSECWFCDPALSWQRGRVLAAPAGGRVRVRAAAGGAELALRTAQVQHYDAAHDERTHDDMTGAL